MSAWLVSEKHVLAVANEYVCRVELGGHRRTDSGDYTMIMSVAKVLWSANVKSVNTLYDKTHRRGRINMRNLDLFAGYRDGALLKLVDCLDYQSCEYDGWAGSKAKAMLNQLEETLTHNVCREGHDYDVCREGHDYNNADWGI